MQHGIERGDAADANGNPPDWLTVGKTELANLDIGLGRYDESAKLLTDPPHPVVASVAVTDEATRPAEGVKGRPFASYVFQSLLRAQIGRHQVDASLEAMQQLEKIAGASGAEGVTAIYVSLGKEIEKEIGRLIATNDRTRLTEVRKSFDKFLEELSRRSETMSYGSLLWIAETYTGLGEGLSEDSTAAREYFAKARTPMSCCSPAPRLTNHLHVRIACSACNCARKLPAAPGRIRRDPGDHSRRQRRKPRALDVQVAAASLLQEWGAATVSGAELRSVDAIRGLHDPAGGGIVWGWAEIAGRLERKLAGGKADNELRKNTSKHATTFPSAGGSLPNWRRTRRRGPKRSKSHWERLTRLLVSTDVNEDAWRRLDTLYQEIETDLGRQATPLARPDLRTSNAVATAGSAAATPKSGPTTDDSAPTAAAPNASTQAAATARTDKPAANGVAPIWILFGLVFGVAFTVTAVVWNIRRQQPTRTSIRSLGSPEFVDLPGRPQKRAKPAGAGTDSPSKPAGSSVSRKPSGAVPHKKAGPKPP